jgi:predicted Zn-dependent protease
MPASDYPAQQEYYPPPAPSFNRGYAPSPEGYSNQNLEASQQPSFPSENQIPEFGKPLPVVPAYNGTNQGVPTNGNGWVTQLAPVASPNISSNIHSNIPAAVRPAVSVPESDEQRVMRLEQTAFGSTYPEHVIEDRVEHLEREIIGQSNDGPIPKRLSQLEIKLNGQSTFGSESGGSVAVQNEPKVQNANSSQIFAMAPLPILPDIAALNEAKHASTKHKEKAEEDPDYFAQIKQFQDGQDSRVARWVNLPVRIHLPQESPESWQMSLENGVKTWGNFLKLKVVPQTEAANIDIIWVNHLMPKILGVTRLETAQGKMHVQIYVLRPTYYLPEIPEHTVSDVFMHELGHALGIFGHSDSPNDLMFSTEISPGQNGKPARVHYAQISKRDENTLKKIYESPTLQSGFELDQPLEWSDSI